jgi:purine-cytosine permease-like protein
MKDLLERMSLEKPLTVKSFLFWLAATIAIASVAAGSLSLVMLAMGRTFMAIAPVP